MGNASSVMRAHKEKHFYADHPRVRPHALSFQALGLSEDDVCRLHGFFQQLARFTVASDKAAERQHHNDRIRVGAILAFLDIERTPLSSTLFTLFAARDMFHKIQRSSDGTGVLIGFMAWVLAMWNLCTVPVFCLSAFVFELYDHDESSSLEMGELAAMLADTFGGTEALQSRPSVAALYDKLLAGSMSMDSSGAGGAVDGGRGGEVDSTSVSFVEFRDFCTLYGTFLGPVVVLQHACRLAFGGDAFWDALTARRQAVSERILAEHPPPFPGLPVAFLATHTILQVEGEGEGPELGGAEAPGAEGRAEAGGGGDLAGMAPKAGRGRSLHGGTTNVPSQTANPLLLAPSPLAFPAPPTSFPSSPTAKRPYRPPFGESSVPLDGDALSTSSASSLGQGRRNSPTGKPLRCVPLSQVLSSHPGASRCIKPTTKTNRGTMYLSPGGGQAVGERAETRNMEQPQSRHTSCKHTAHSSAKKEIERN